MGKQNLAELQVKMAEHIIAQYSDEKDDVRAILTETKVGAETRPALPKIIKKVFPRSRLVKNSGNGSSEEVKN